MFEIEFHDASVHAEIVMDNTSMNYVFGDLNNNLVALASRGNSDREAYKKILCSNLEYFLRHLHVRHITAWDGDSHEWNHILYNNGEFIDHLTVGLEFVAIYTTLRFIRIFTAAGTQRLIASLPGKILNYLFLF